MKNKVLDNTQLRYTIDKNNVYLEAVYENTVLNSKKVFEGSSKEECKEWVEKERRQMEIELALLEKVEEETGVKFDFYFKRYEDDVDKVIVTHETFMQMLDELVHIIENYKEEIEDIQRDVEENYTKKEFNPYMEYGVSESDFH